MSLTCARKEGRGRASRARASSHTHRERERERERESEFLDDHERGRACAKQRARSSSLSSLYLFFLLTGVVYSAVPMGALRADGSTTSGSPAPTGMAAIMPRSPPRPGMGPTVTDTLPPDARTQAMRASSVEGRLDRKEGRERAAAGAVAVQRRRRHRARRATGRARPRKRAGRGSAPISFLLVERG